MGRRRTLKSRRRERFQTAGLMAGPEAEISRLKKRRTLELKGPQRFSLDTSDSVLENLAHGSPMKTKVIHHQNQINYLWWRSIKNADEFPTAFVVLVFH